MNISLEQEARSGLAVFCAGAPEGIHQKVGTGITRPQNYCKICQGEDQDGSEQTCQLCSCGSYHRGTCKGTTSVTNDAAENSRGCLESTRRKFAIDKYESRNEHLNRLTSRPENILVHSRTFWKCGRCATKPHGPCGAAAAAALDGMWREERIQGTNKHG